MFYSLIRHKFYQMKKFIAEDNPLYKDHLLLKSNKLIIK